MSELERALAVVGAELEWPATPDLAGAVAARLQARQRRPAWLRPAAIALAVLVLAIGVAFAVPQARSALLRFLHIRGATVERVETLPPAQEQDLASRLGEPATVAAAERRAGFHLILPSSVDRVYVRGTLVSALLRREGKPLLLTELRSGTGAPFLKKIAGAETGVQWVSVAGQPGIWLEGGEHILLEPGQVPVKVRGNVLLWEHGEVTLRLEGRLKRGQALAIAESLR